MFPIVERTEMCYKLLDWPDRSIRRHSRNVTGQMRTKNSQTSTSDIKRKKKFYCSFWFEHCTHRISCCCRFYALSVCCYWWLRVSECMNTSDSLCWNNITAKYKNKIWFAYQKGSVAELRATQKGRRADIKAEIYIFNVAEAFSPMSHDKQEKSIEQLFSPPATPLMHALTLFQHRTCHLRCKASVSVVASARYSAVVANPINQHFRGCQNFFHTIRRFEESNQKWNYSALLSVFSIDTIAHHQESKHGKFPLDAQARWSNR